MTFRYFDVHDRPLDPDELRAMDIVTPVMEHIFAGLLQRQRAAGEENDTSRRTVAADSSFVIK